MYATDIRPVPGFPNYGVSRAGVVFRLFTLTGRFVCRTLKQRTDGHKNRWHPHVRLSRDGVVRNKYVHELTALTFLGPRPPGFEIDHIDCDPTNNQVSNLEYVTTGENKRRYHESKKYKELLESQSTHGWQVPKSQW